MRDPVQAIVNGVAAVGEAFIGVMCWVAILGLVSLLAFGLVRELGG